MKKFLFALATVLTLSAGAAQARGPYYGGHRGYNYYTPPRQVVVVRQPVYYAAPNYGGGYYYSNGYYSSGNRDVARVGAVILGVGALALAASSF